MLLDICTDGPVPLALRERPGTDGLPAVVFINSLGTDHRIWEPLIPHLPTDWPLLFHDKRGHGLSGAAPADTSITDYAEDVATLLAARGTGPAIVVGLSIGGLIAQALASRHPDQVRALVLVCTAAKIGTTEMWQERISALAADGLGPMVDTILERWFPARFREQAPTMPLWRTMLERSDLAGYIVACAALRDADLTERARRLHQPTLCVAGEQDLATPPAVMNELAGLIPHARLEVLSGCGHIPCVQVPDHLGAMITHFVGELAV